MGFPVNRTRALLFFPALGRSPCLNSLHLGNDLFHRDHRLVNRVLLQVRGCELPSVLRVNLAQGGAFGYDHSRDVISFLLGHFRLRGEKLSAAATRILPRFRNGIDDASARCEPARRRLRHAMISLATFPYTSVSRKSRPL